MIVVQDDLWLCSDCMTAVNGDFTGLDYHYGEKAEARMKEIESGLDALGPHLVPNNNEDEGREEFSTRDCDCCGTRLAGMRERFVILGEEP